MVIIGALVALAAGLGRPAAAGLRLVEAFPRLQFERPLYLAELPDGSGRLVLLEQDGRIHLFENRPDADATELALDLTGQVRRVHNEEGLLGLAFHPGFAANRQVFLFYSASDPRRDVLSRFTFDEDRRKILRSSEEVLLEVTQPWGNHNGGMIEFGPDGFLYVSYGDGGAAGDPHGNAQNLRSLLGKILRIDVDRCDPGRPYAVPPDNPFVDTPGARPEIWAWGLRNVWRFSFDRATGRLWAGDVGQYKWEEIDLIEKGGNYGWNFREGAHPYAHSRKKQKLTPPADRVFIDPIVEHFRTEARSITGGYVYRGRRLPTLAGAYLYGDFVTGYLWALRYDGERVTEHWRIGEAPAPASFGEDGDGEIYIVCFDGKIYTLAGDDP
jgi:glucose/arabinose dehydrogenase